ncbi:MAG: RNA 2',3'-cyclic phosphodiesterase [Candidatus Moranbacteria bacterium]|nr:RNA 2',3'-cyclic phosphodiesterase [Candidatus Moranbacteria bacterium]
MNKTRRLFVGIPLSKELKKRLVREMEAFPREASLLTREENLHVTVFFLGFVHEEQVADVCARVGVACSGLEAFELEFTGLELMESPENPKMIWLAGEASEGLKQLREEIEKEFSSFIAEKKVYRPHITLAKIKKPKWLALTVAPVLKEKLHLVEPVDTVCVFESLSLDGKRRYEPIDTFSLL